MAKVQQFIAPSVTCVNLYRAFGAGLCVEPFIKYLGVFSLHYSACIFHTIQGLVSHMSQAKTSNKANHSRFARTR